MRWNSYYATSAAAMSAAFVDVASMEMTGELYGDRSASRTKSMRQGKRNARATNGRRSKQGDSECDCLNWQDTYSSGEVTCGQGNELSAFAQFSDLSWEQVVPFAQQILCTSFFERLDSNRCVRLNMEGSLRSSPNLQRQGTDTSSSKHWCFVPSSCKHLGGGGPVAGGASLGWKMCVPGKDPTFNDMSLTDLYDFAYEHSIDFGYLLGAAYQTDSNLWEDVEQSWWLGDSQHISLLASQVQEPLIYEVSSDGTGDKVVAVGDELWAVNYDSTIHARNSFSLQCIQSCGFRAIESAKQTMQNTRAYSQFAACECLNWQDTYATGQVHCGQGQELVLSDIQVDLPWTQVLPFVEREICTGFFERLDRNYCVDATTSDGAQSGSNRNWCYVSSRCRDLRGGHLFSGTSFAWKYCQRKIGGDELLQDVADPELVMMAAMQGLDIDVLRRAAGLAHSSIVGQQDREHEAIVAAIDPLMHRRRAFLKPQTVDSSAALTAQRQIKERDESGQSAVPYVSLRGSTRRNFGYGYDPAASVAPNANAWRAPWTAAATSARIHVNLGCIPGGNGCSTPWHKGMPGAIVGGIAYVTIVLTLIGLSAASQLSCQGSGISRCAMDNPVIQGAATWDATTLVDSSLRVMTRNDVIGRLAKAGSVFPSIAPSSRGFEFAGLLDVPCDHICIDVG